MRNKSVLSSDAIKYWFIEHVEADIPLKDVTKVNKVIGVGKTLNKFIVMHGV